MRCLLAAVGGLLPSSSWGKGILLGIVPAMALSAISAMAGEIRTIGWAEMVPEQPPLADPLADQPMSVRFDLGFAAKVIGDARDGVISDAGPEYLNARAVLDRLRTTGVDVDLLLEAFSARDRAIEARKFAVTPALDGEIVRIPGYALPLTEAKTGVTSFLLVPYVGACIHYPPPPANQIVLAELDHPHQFQNRFETVWITGRLSMRSASRALDYVDGRANVATAYTMDVIDISAYGTDPSAETFAGSFSPSAAGPQLRLSRSGSSHSLTAKRFPAGD